jgi:hypothetical protein
MSVPIGAADYYDLFPSTSHNPGDIWTGLPTFGVLDVATAPGIVITPACDLSNGKVESITYLPIVPVRRFVISRAVLPEIKRAISGLLEAGGMTNLDELPAGHSWPMSGDLKVLSALISEQLADALLPKKIQVVLQRAQRGLEILTHCCAESSADISLAQLIALIGQRDWTTLMARIITNARSDSHFLPADEQRPDWSALSEHSVALLRFPLSIPIEVFEMSQRVTPDQWDPAAKAMARLLPCVSSIPVRPMKRLRLQERFTADLLTRFTAVFTRLGSPDFTPATVTKFTNDLSDL